MRQFLYLATRVASLLPVWLAVSLLAFGLGNLAPGDPAEAIYYQSFGEPPTDQRALDQLREELGLNDPLPLRYGRWLVNALRGDLGNSYRTGLPVWPDLTQRLWVTLQLAFGGLLVTGVIAFPLGILAAVRHNSRTDMLARIFSLAGASLPSYWLAYILILLFAVFLNWLPVAGSGSFRHLVLPSLTLGLGGAALLSRLLRSAMLESLSHDYIGVARAKGLPEHRVVLVHALRNALIPVVTVLGNLLGLLLSGAIIVETVFSWPGLGRLIVDSIQFRDYPVIQGFVLLTGSFFVLINLMVDLSYTWIDPRVSLVRKGA